LERVVKGRNEARKREGKEGEIIRERDREEK
jgi:hypothetical protein